MNEQPSLRKIRVLDGSFSSELTNVVNDFFEKKAVNILKEVVGSSCPARNVRMWGSIGSYAICFRGQAAEYTGAFVDVPPPTDIVKEMTVYHQKQIKAMKDAGMFHLLFETISSLKEAQAICDALENHSDVKAVISFTCRKDGLSLRHGESFESAVKYILGNPKVSSHSDRVGTFLNCDNAPCVSVPKVVLAPF
ncbi:unnamed protein product [Haemonchus placei]|uniref:Hcy-binding domain-containing protein n=1 Tax=Haemonchus placei TaxID=6290 RepID=A0A0N4X6L2_HAEPC|nr:unnamed protein product [Haemonchus placei]